jgi:copper chaperone CopZ
MNRNQFSLSATPTDNEVSQIKHALEGLSGVSEVVVEPRARRVTIAYDGNADTTDQIIAALDAIDITATLKTP